VAYGRRDSLNITNTLISAGEDLNYQNSNGYTALIIGCLKIKISIKVFSLINFHSSKSIWLFQYGKKFDKSKCKFRNKRSKRPNCIDGG
jgi:hypothetical protein